jgi:hypothetical protein
MFNFRLIMLHIAAALSLLGFFLFVLAGRYFWRYLSSGEQNGDGELLLSAWLSLLGALPVWVLVAILALPARRNLSRGALALIMSPAIVLSLVMLTVLWKAYAHS